MSTLDQDEADKQLQRAVPWVSDPQHTEQRDNETRRLQEDVIEAAKRLEREPVELQPSEGRGTAVGFRLSDTRMRGDGRSSRANKVDSEEAARKIWAQLKPQFIAEPAQDGLGLRSLALAAAFFGALAVSAVVAMIVVNVVHTPAMLSADVTDKEHAAKGSPLAVLSDLAKVSESHAKMTRADEPPASTEAPIASAQPDDSAVLKPVAAVPLRTAKVEPVQPEATAPAANPAPAASPAPEPQRAAPLPQDEVASLLKRGRDLIAAGDIASARLMLTLVAEAGNAEASFTLAGTFDPAVLARLPAIGVRADPEKARAWYARAAEQGSQEAKQRLQALR